MSACTPDHPCTQADRCDECERDFQTLAGHADPLGVLSAASLDLPAPWHLEPGPRDILRDEMTLWYGDQQVASIHSSVGAASGATYWHVGGRYQLLTPREAVDQAIADWSPVIAANRAAGRPPLWRGAAVGGTGDVSTDEDWRAAGVFTRRGRGGRR